MLTVQSRRSAESSLDAPALEFCQMERPKPEFSQVVIDVSYAGVNQADLLQAQGKYPPPRGATPVLGLEVSGTVSDIGSGVTSFSPGDQVVALLSSGGYGEQVAVDASLVLPLPTALTLQQGAGVMEAACTAWNNLYEVAGLAPAQSVLIHGASGGVGSFAVQLASALGNTVIATARTRERADRCLALGASSALAYSGYPDFAQSLPDLVSDLTDGHGADVIFDVLGAQYLSAHIKSLAQDGRLITIGLQRGAQGTLNLGALLAKRASIHGTTLRSRPLAQRAAIVASVHTHVWPLIELGAITPVIHAVLPLAQANAAHELLASGEVFGKVLLDCTNVTLPA